MRELPITLPSLNVAVVKVPEKVSKQDFDMLKSMLAAWEGALVATPRNTSNRQSPSRSRRMTTSQTSTKATDVRAESAARMTGRFH
jgi:hypothetical protein